MSERDGSMPRPEVALVVAGMIAAAVALALVALCGRKGRRAFLAALTAVADQHERLEGVIVFGAVGNHRRAMSQAVSGGVAFIRRLVVELEDGEAK